MGKEGYGRPGECRYDADSWTNEDLDCSRIHSITSVHEDLKFLVSRWSAESHTSIAASGKFGPMLEDVFNLMACPCMV